jgi:3-deoxy-manno-octulosonate cytidylyltransferase (CMP-KDO synthetase)
MINSQSDIGTLAVKIKNNLILNNKDVVKVITKDKLESDNFPVALNFVRNNSLKTNENIYHHIGIYCYKVSILEKFINLKQTQNEIDNKLEQLRALDNGLDINVALAESSPIGVDTKEDYLAIKKIMEYKLLK